ncbi:WD40-repeat-containing domain protein [Pseudomassariella vexata]|uniref:Probable cytosolic iron-sulfur protein assembly protein 1 n=1 Tax=Pseudomassariella vexata TaxID=1141098 RepID=A0A1Y2DYB3_9PEZI|nr:WD40-repeat-containing domain protein [Pseudomassariella vexata]ORY64243.1 WD40-repeat-containing domain protein [Pseudomassariella vexata]
MASATSHRRCPPMSSNSTIQLFALPHFKPDLYERAWQSIPHPHAPLIATAHHKSVTIFSLSTLSSHSTLSGGHERSVRSIAWKPYATPNKLCLVTGSFDRTAGLWRWEEEGHSSSDALDITATRDSSSDKEDKDWEFTLVLEGHDSEIKSVAFAPGGQYLATCSRDKSVWIWEDIGASESDDEWETVAVLNEHEGDVKAVAWCPETNRRDKGRYAPDCLASASYDNTVRIWREDGDGEWVCVAVLEGHEGTVWGIAWEPRPEGTRYPRLMSWSADCTIRVWELKEEDEEEDKEPQLQYAWGGLRSIPNTMRRSMKDEWECTDILPKAHTRDIYSAAWSQDSGLVASTGSDGILAIYEEEAAGPGILNGERHATDAEANAELDGDVPMTNRHDATPKKQWYIKTTKPNAHGPYEVNHVTWCKRYDSACPPERKGIEEMLVTTGDDGIVRPWQVIR